MTVRIDTLRMCFDSAVVTKSHMDDAALVRSHRPEGNRSVLTIGARSSAQGKTFDLLTLAVLIAFDIDADWIPETNDSMSYGRNESLHSLERMAPAANEDAKIAPDDVENDFTVIALVFVDFCTLRVEMLEDVADNSDASICNLVKLFVGQRFFILIGGFRIFRNIFFIIFVCNVF